MREEFQTDHSMNVWDLIKIVAEKTDENLEIAGYQIELFERGGANYVVIDHESRTVSVLWRRNENG